jgi:uncharacterized surface protein with fasciclin (FAS1) repeats
MISADNPLIAFGRCRIAFAALVLATIAAGTACASSQTLREASASAAAADEADAPPIATSSTAPASSPTFDEVLAQDRFVALAIALERSGLDDVLDGLDDFVLLAPIGDAFASSGADIGIEYSTLMNDPRLLEAILRYHIVASPSNNESWRTLNGSQLDADGSTADTIERVDDVEVLDRISVSNGTVLVIPRILLPVR